MDPSRSRGTGDIGGDDEDDDKDGDDEDDDRDGDDGTKDIILKLPMWPLKKMVNPMDPVKMTIYE